MSKETLNQGIDYAKAGNKTMAIKFLSDFVRHEPRDETAWLWLASCLDEMDKKSYCLKRVLEINPNNIQANQALLKIIDPKQQQSNKVVPITGQTQPTPVSTFSNLPPTSTTNVLNKQRSIEFVPATCPKCGGELRVPKDRDVIKCMYCGVDVILHDPNRIIVETRVNIEKILPLAKDALYVKNYDDAFKYYSQVLEQDSEIREAWLGKGVSAGMLSTAHNLRAKEADQYLKKGVLGGLKRGEFPDPTLEYICRGYYIQLAGHMLELIESVTNDYELKEELGWEALRFYGRAYSLKEPDIEWRRQVKFPDSQYLLSQTNIKKMIIYLTRMMFSLYKINIERYIQNKEEIIENRRRYADIVLGYVAFGGMSELSEINRTYFDSQPTLYKDPDIDFMLSEFTNEVAKSKKKNSWWKELFP